MDEWLATLKAAGPRARSPCTPTAICCRRIPGHAVALLEDDVVVVRPPTGATISMPADALAEALRARAPRRPEERGEQTGRGLILYTGAAEWQHHSPQVEAVRDQFDGIKVQLLTSGPLPLFAQQLPTAQADQPAAGSLCAAEHAAPSAGARGAWRRFLLAALVGLHVAGKATELFMLKRAEKTVDASIDQAFRAAMPGEQNTDRCAAPHGSSGSSPCAVAAATGLLPALGALVAGTQRRARHHGAGPELPRWRAGAEDRRAQCGQPGPREPDACAATAGRRTSPPATSCGQGYEGRIQMRPAGGTS